MVELFVGIILLGLGMIAASLQRLYSIVPPYELKRQASQGDQLAKKLYRVVAYGDSLRLLLWVLVATASTIGISLIASTVPFLLAIIVIGIALTIFFILLSSLSFTRSAAYFAAWWVPGIAWMLNKSHSLLAKLANQARRWQSETHPHTRLYEKQDLLAFIDRQKQQEDNRIDEVDLSLAVRGLVLRDSRVYDYIIPRKDMFVVDAQSEIGPILLDKLHKHQQSSFLVYRESNENIVGSMTMGDALKARHGGKVEQLIRHEIIYIHEDFTLGQALTALQKTSQQLAVVINSNEECLGVVTLDILLEALLGKPDDIDLSYSDRTSIAGYTADREGDVKLVSSPEATEVIE